MPASAQSCSAISETARKTPRANSETSESAGVWLTGRMKGTKGRRLPTTRPMRRQGTKSGSMRPDLEDGLLQDEAEDDADEEDEERAHQRVAGDGLGRRLGEADGVRLLVGGGEAAALDEVAADRAADDRGDDEAEGGHGDADLGAAGRGRGR